MRYRLLNIGQDQTCPNCGSKRWQIAARYARGIGTRGGYYWDQKTVRCLDCLKEWDGTATPPKEGE